MAQTVMILGRIALHRALDDGGVADRAMVFMRPGRWNFSQAWSR